MRNGNCNFAKYVIVSDSYFFWDGEHVICFPFFFLLNIHIHL